MPTIADEKDAKTERQHTSHEVITIAVEHLALGIHQQLCRRTRNHQSCRPGPMATIKQQTVHNVELKHQPEEPERAGPDVAIRSRKKIIKHAKLPYNLHKGIMPRGCSDGVDDDKGYKSCNHHLEKLQEMVARKTVNTQAWRFCIRLQWCQSILHFKAKSTQKQENGHAIMAEKGKQMGGIETIHARSNL